MYVLCPGVITFHAPALSLVHVVTSLSARRGEGGREPETDRRDGPVEWHFVWVSRLLCARGDNTSHYTLHTHTHTLDQNSLRYTHMLRSRVSTEQNILRPVSSKILPFSCFCYGSMAGCLGSGAAWVSSSKQCNQSTLLLSCRMLF